MTIRLSAEHREWIEEQARREGISPSEFVRHLIIVDRRGHR